MVRGVLDNGHRLGRDRIWQVQEKEGCSPGHRNCSLGLRLSSCTRGCARPTKTDRWCLASKGSANGLVTWTQAIGAMESLAHQIRIRRIRIGVSTNEAQGDGLTSTALQTASANEHQPRSMRKRSTLDLLIHSHTLSRRSVIAGLPLLIVGCSNSGRFGPGAVQEHTLVDLGDAEDLARLVHSTTMWCLLAVAEPACVLGSKDGSFLRFWIRARVASRSVQRPQSVLGDDDG